MLRQTALHRRDHRGSSTSSSATNLRAARRPATTAERAYDRAERDEAEERFGDYQDLVETGTEILADLRDNFASSLDDETAEEYEAEFNRAVAKRLPRFALEIENR